MLRKRFGDANFGENKSGILNNLDSPTRFSPSTPTIAQPEAKAIEFQNPFCRECTRNQEIQLNLLANYPEEEEKLTSLSDFKKSLEIRFPIVCEDCWEGVEKTIAGRDFKVRAYLLNNRLKRGGRRKFDEFHSVEEKEKRERYWRWALLGLVWRIRGGLFWLTSLGYIGLAGMGFYDSIYLISKSDYVGSILNLSFSIVSILWSFYNPLWNKLRNLKSQGREIRIQNRNWWIRCQIVSYLTRTTLAILFQFELIQDPLLSKYINGFASLSLILLLLISKHLLYLKKPPPIQLKSTPIPPPPIRKRPEDPLSSLAQLSLSPFSSRPPSPPISPIKPNSFFSNSNSLKLALEAPPKFGENNFGQTEVVREEMEWLPSPANVETFEFGPQRFFVEGGRAEGLEELMEKVSVVEAREEGNRGWREWLFGSR